MSLVTGNRIGVYEIIGAIGAGGMGEVYRARDTQLDREVAIKILPAVFALDAERLARFEREAKTLASLNHPHIAQIYGLEPFDGGRALVMELVDGEDLSARIARGPVALDDALAIARQVAEALEASHERGIIHRDLKPANIKVRDDGTVKVLDFGLAKALDASSVSGVDLVNSPTITSPATQLGTILGTAAYMAPEQAKGRAIDRRADVWAFGVVLFEMLTGRRAFAGEDVTEVVAAVLKDAVPLEALPATTPPAVRRLLRRCLQRDRAKRLDSMAAARLEIEEAVTAPAASHERATAASRPSGRVAALAAVGMMASAAIGGGLVWSATRPALPIVSRLSLIAPEGQQIRVETNHHDVAIARDGSRVVYWTEDALKARVP
jgi:serine/threonine-protein kinase